MNNFKIRFYLQYFIINWHQLFLILYYEGMDILEVNCEVVRDIGKKQNAQISNLG